MKNPKIATALFLFVTASLANSQSSSTKAVSAGDVLQQVDAVVVNDSFGKHTAAETLELVKEIVALNQMQLEYADLQNKGGKGIETLHALSPDWNQTFYNLRAAVCKRYPGMVVDLDGTLHYCG